MPRRRRRERFDLNADVNVVSLIDVMLLLLVIFMITAPMMQGGVDISLPAGDAKPIDAKDALGVSINRAGDIYIGEEKYNLNEFRTVFKTLPKNRTRNGVYLRADQNVGYGIVAQVMAIMNGDGINDVALVFQPENIK